MCMEDLKLVWLEEYELFSFFIEMVDFEFDFDFGWMKVCFKLVVKWNLDVEYDGMFCLYGEELEFLVVKVNGEILEVDGYEIDVEGFNFF